MVLRIGFNVWYGDQPLYPVLRDCYEVGYDHVELAIDYPWTEGLGKVEEELRRALRDFNLTLGVHAPWRDVALASPVPELREAAVKVVKRVIDLATRLRADYVNTHVTSSEATEFREIEEQILRAALESTRILRDYCREKGVDLIIENDSSKPLASLQHLAEILYRVDDVYFCLDIGHAILYHRPRVPIINYRPIIEDYLQVLGRKLLLTHLHDVREESGKVRDHLPPGEGVVDLREVLKLILRRAQPRYLVLEVFKHWNGAKVKPRDTLEVVKCIRTTIGLHK